MSIRHVLPARLEGSPRSGARLRAELEARTGAPRAPDATRVRAALAGLEVDELVAREDPEAEPRVRYALTEAGRAELGDWYARPVEPGSVPRDELTIKLVMAVDMPGVDMGAVVEIQPRRLRESLREDARQRCAALAELPAHRDEVARLLLLDQMVLHAEAQPIWLDHCGARLHRLRGAAAPEPAGEST
ncbi:PadR family transcriptional regulator [Streptomyces glomeratus]|uniref:Transcription regulator PadR N-terminal domain-containing protein n=1 Tax=Streptomyces glomeratus TaxID=284452 RepID=A0ABP6LF77_9ACTN|nr:helix-turn-helix transcriptional regulator [Streptomyces glomeratus]MCF1506734.1 PadR family transcriptional regulator [Streptomyces glomeratus]